MARTSLILAIAVLCSPTSMWGQSKAQTSSPLTRFVIDVNRPYVYLRYDHMGKGVKFSEDEPTQRVWLRFVNNCSVAIVLRTFGAPDGSLKDEVGVFHDVVEDKQFRIHTVKVEPPQLNALSSEPPPTVEMPMGYDSDVRSAETVPPGESVLFSVPTTHLSKSWHIEIPYEFDVPPGKGPRQPIIGGQPKMVLIYSAWDLPEDVRRQLSKTQ